MFPPPGGMLHVAPTNPLPVREADATLNSAFPSAALKLFVLSILPSGVRLATAFVVTPPGRVTSPTANSIWPSLWSVADLPLLR